MTKNFGQLYSLMAMSSNTVEFPSARDLMTRYVLMLPSSATFGDLVELMYKNRVSAIVINNPETQNYYIISHTDVIEFLHKVRIPSGDIYTIPLKNIMKSPVQIIDQNISVDKVIRLMNEHGYKRLVLGKNGMPTGIISARDILLWNNRFFRPGKPLILLVVDNDTSILIAKHTFKDNLEREINDDLIEIYGGALASINTITNEVIHAVGKMRVLQKDNYSILFEPREKITGILVATYNNIELRRRLFAFVESFIESHKTLLESEYYSNKAKEEIDISHSIQMFDL